MPFLEWLERTRIATAIEQSGLLTGILSSVHLLGLVLIVGSALVTCLRSLGYFLPEQPFGDVAILARKIIATGLGISVATGLFLFASRASMAAENSAFQIKMILLLAALLFHFTLFRQVTRRNEESSLLRLTGGLGLMLWFGVGLAGCWYILFE
jgi:hypothetical protein